MRKLLLPIRAAAGILLVFTLLLGVAYPLLVTSIAQIVFPHQASGSLIEKDGKIIGSQLLGQSFGGAKYFWGRPSATTPSYNAAASSGSNLSPANPELLKTIKTRVAVLRRADPANQETVPVDLVTASASGLDPHISPEAARYQAKRVARARNMSASEVIDLIILHTEDSTFGLLGRPRVNVLMLNMALDERNAGAKEKR